MKKTRRLQFITLMTTAMALLACNQGYVLNPYKYDEGRYKDVEVVSLEKSYATFTYADYDDNSFYASYGYEFGYSPSVGNVNYIVIPIWFTDSSDYILEENRELIRSDINTAYFGTSEEVGWESVKTYYAKDSFGKLNVGGITTEWYECGRPSSDFYVDQSDVNTKRLMYDASIWAKENIEDISIYDSDKDGYLDGVVFIYGCPDSQCLAYYTGTSSSDYSNLWGYTSWMMNNQLKDKNNPGLNTLFWASYDFMYSYGYHASRRTGKAPCGNGNTNDMKIDSHTFIHEAGHMFGLPDYYDYGYSSSPALSFSMQDYNVGGHDPYSRFSLGWAKAIVPTETCRVTLKPMEESGEFIILSPNFSGSPFDEYIALELFSPTGLNEFDMTMSYNYACSGIKKTGVRMWHVDSRLYSIKRINNYTGEIKEGNLTTDPTEGKVVAATDNNSPLSGMASKLAGKASYNQLSVVRRDFKTYDPDNGYKKDDNRNSMVLVEKDLFMPGDYFTVEQYKKQFVEKEKLNSGNSLGWAIHFEDFNEDGSMTITLIKR